MKADLQLFNNILNDLLEDEINNPVVKPIKIEELHEVLDLKLNDEPAIDEEFSQNLRNIVLNTPRTATKMFFNQLFGGRNGKAVLGDLLAVVLNSSMYTYKIGGPQIGIEKEVIHTIRDLVGYGENSGGTFATGGSMCNFMGMLMARDAFNLRIRHEGVAPNMTAYTSKESHYSISKNASFVGIGRNNVRYVPTNDRGEMLPDELEKRIKSDIDNGLNPFLVNGTSGTTVLGAFDPLDEIAHVCEKYGVWFHVDAAYGGSVLFSKKYKHLISGIERADSFNVNAHKMLGTPLSCSMIFSKEEKSLYDTFSNDANYLYQTAEDAFNPGKISFQCGRRNDALKFWTLWKAVGTKGLEEIVNHEFHLADIARDYIRQNSDYTLYSSDESTAICFNYKDYDARAVCNLLYDEGEIMVGYGAFQGQQFIRLVTVNHSNQKEDILRFFTKLEEFTEVHAEKLHQQSEV